MEALLSSRTALQAGNCDSTLAAGNVVRSDFEASRNQGFAAAEISQDGSMLVDDICFPQATEKDNYNIHDSQGLDATCEPDKHPSKSRSTDHASGKELFHQFPGNSKISGSWGEIPGSSSSSGLDEEEQIVISPQTYFEDSFEAFYGVVYRPEFETRLVQHFERGTSDDDASWYALRNVVYATGCRTFLAKQNLLSWAEIQRRSWPFFENSLSVYVELLYTPTGLSAVRALAAMNLHLEGAGNPALESMMCISAVRLAQTKGLHRQPASSWGLPQDEVLHRNWLFWAIYVHEKQVTHRSGRPSTIDDDNISCQVPSSIVPGSTIDRGFLTSMINHAQISARIYRKLLTVSSFRQAPMTFIETMAELSLQLELWKDSLSPALRPGTPISIAEFPSTRDLNKVMYLQFAYYGSLTAIHTIFYFPWISVICGINAHDTAHSSQIASSSKIVAETARNIIQATRFMRVDAASPQWYRLVFYFPMVGLINLFLYILKHPSLPSAPSDVAFLDIAVGHFGHLEVLTSSELRYPFAREVARLAYTTVKNHNRTSMGSTNPKTPANHSLRAPEFDASEVNFADEEGDLDFNALVADGFSIFGTDDIPIEGDMVYFPP
ncbi:uncharacterized protein A1O9_07236 [Exophiala aquamarina CBS 119918]|uniref:Xylanolytic transcriptional activator regulatory domain-containing protein n=1 Tax=Exophiala aquamarina CBS 119918 TaxID=1182545 RepID=A0A072PAZ2_9EURO|nr:uncharacterized protein A1O9_07236 [Exophiala aquamarina CBS 119918]KEF57046.1 hypothetical protein A1O9_07236 [Exophiala aquamarina CBS 119918]